MAKVEKRKQQSQEGKQNMLLLIDMLPVFNIVALNMPDTCHNFRGYQGRC